MKNYWKSLTLVLVGVFALSSCDDVPTPYPVPIQEGDATKDGNSAYLQSAHQWYENCKRCYRYAQSYW